MDDNDERLGGHVTIVIPKGRYRRARMLIGCPLSREPGRWEKR
ncbi:unnamed protein product, partial [marine sediment metagenome]